MFVPVLGRFWEQMPEKVWFVPKMRGFSEQTFNRQWRNGHLQFPALRLGAVGQGRLAGEAAEDGEEVVGVLETEVEGDFLYFGR